MINDSCIQSIMSVWSTDYLVMPGVSRAEHSADYFVERAEKNCAYQPYYTVLKESARPPLKDFSRAQIGRTERLVDAGEIRNHLDAGYTLKVDKLEYIDPAVLALIGRLEAAFACTGTAYAFITPEHSQGLAYHRDASHVLVIQTEGEKHWHIWRPTGDVVGTAGIDPDPQGWCHSVVATPLIGGGLGLEVWMVRRRLTFSDRSEISIALKAGCLVSSGGSNE